MSGTVAFRLVLDAPDRAAGARAPVSGSLAVEGGRQRRFTGYVELIAALENARADEDAQGEPPAEPSGRS